MNAHLIRIRIVVWSLASVLCSLLLYNCAHAEAKYGSWSDTAGIWEIERSDTNISTSGSLAACKSASEKNAKEYGATRTSGYAYYSCQIVMRVDFVLPSVPNSVVLNWTPPTQNTDGSALTNLNGFKIFYGTSVNAMTQTVLVLGATIKSYKIENLDLGKTYYFAIAATTSDGRESANSNVVSKKT